MPAGTRHAGTGRSTDLRDLLARGRHRPLVAVAALLVAVLLAPGLVRPALAQAPDGFGAGDLVGEATLPGLGIRLVDTPRALAADPRAQVYIVDHVRPGARLERHLDISNGTDASMEVDLYAAAAETTDGWLVGDGRAANELTGWTTMTPSRLTLAPGERRRVRVDIVVPNDAFGGERYMALLAAPAAPDTDESPPAMVAVTSRVGVRAYLSVGGVEAPVQDFVIDRLTAARGDDGAGAVVIDVTNTGERALDLTGSLSLADGPGSLAAGPFPVAAARTVGPGSATTLLVPMDAALPAGPWLARVTLRSGLLVREAEADVTFPEEAGTVAVPSPARPVERAPWLLLALSLLLVAGAGLFAALRLGRSRDNTQVGHDPDLSTAGRNSVEDASLVA